MVYTLPMLARAANCAPHDLERPLNLSTLVCVVVVVHHLFNNVHIAIEFVRRLVHGAMVGGQVRPRPSLPRPSLPRPSLPRPSLPRPSLPRPYKDLCLCFTSLLHCDLIQFQRYSFRHISASTNYNSLAITNLLLLHF